MRDNSTIEFKVLKNTWGIYIKIKASTSLIDKKEKIEYEHIYNNLYLQFNDSIRLSKSERDMFIEGIRSTINLFVSENPILVTIEEILFIDSDFQLEGIYWAAKKLIADLVGAEFQMPLFEFDSKLNKYLFSDK